MRILLLRHGAAGAGSDPGLSNAGSRGVEMVLDALELEGGAAMLAHSPLRRAVETADLCAQQWPVAQRVECEELLPETRPVEAGEALASRAELVAPASPLDTGMIVVSHLPLLPALAHWLTGEALPFDPGSAWLLDADGFWMGMATPLRSLHVEAFDGLR